jgi:hypothetical protein
MMTMMHISAEQIKTYEDCLRLLQESGAGEAALADFMRSPDGKNMISFLNGVTRALNER